MEREVEAIEKAIDLVSKELEKKGMCLKPKQLEAVVAFCSGMDQCFVSRLPTGYGKSIIYAILPLIF